MLQETATLAGGCFWCLEAVYADLKGVSKVVSGYSGGKTPNPSYESVCTGSTGHAEVVHISFDPETISFDDLLSIFFAIHDPTTLNRQSADVGTQYRSAIFYHSQKQKEIAKQVMEEMAPKWINPIVTEVSAFEKLYIAEAHHQNYFAINPNQPYCRAVVAPKIEKFRKNFMLKLK